MTQKDVADALHVSQPYIAQVERSKPMSLSLMLRYANVVGIAVQFTPQRQATVAHFRT